MFEGRERLRSNCAGDMSKAERWLEGGRDCERSRSQILGCVSELNAWHDWHSKRQSYLLTLYQRRRLRRENPCGSRFGRE